MREMEASSSFSKLAAWFVLLLGVFLVVSTILIAIPSLNPTTTWYVLVPGTAVGSLLALIGFGAIRVVRELQERPGASSLYLYVTIGLALGLGMGASMGVLFDFIALGVSVGSLVGGMAGMAGWISARH